ncbi:threonine-phosphate decarboxylase CobD [Bacillus sp. REN3]|uniref:threonine-phosphate decarboxylase CobD n=1 Tax=Bacillus sp. REN3 TaxID=2802440 RepID=UPI001AEEEE80|nr:threonine-phosphate decarboxylase CobD [Bacillus sp. REN3]
MKWPSHGSNPQYLYAAMKLGMPEEYVDFSANINPLGPPALLKKNWVGLFDRISDYPDPKGAGLRQKIAVKEGLEESWILIGNGGAELISLVGRLLAGKRAVIVQPAFSEYEEACSVNGCEVHYHQLDLGSWELEESVLSSKLQNSDALFLCNPNNPTGVYFPRRVILHLVEECRKHDCLLIVDEAFYDFVPGYEPIVPYIKEYENLLVIRSMTKMFAIPGLRLGYLLAAPEVIRELARWQPQWGMNSIALKAGEWCLDSEQYIARTIQLIESEKQRLFDFYRKRGLKVSPSKANFYLLKDPALGDQLPFFQFLLQQGIIPRHTMNFPGLDGAWLRFAVKSPEDNKRLMEEVEGWLGSRL